MADPVPVSGRRWDAEHGPMRFSSTIMQFASRSPKTNTFAILDPFGLLLRLLGLLWFSLEVLLAALEPLLVALGAILGDLAAAYGRSGDVLPASVIRTKQ